MNQTHTRYAALDLARTAALLGMIAFHSVFDLQMFGLLPYGTTASPFFYWHARIVAGSFLFLAGTSLWLAHETEIRWPAFWRRWGKLAAAAAAVTAATYVALPENFVFFGILHCIAISSLLALPFLRLPRLAVAFAAVAVMAGSYYLPGPAFNLVPLRFLGLATEPTFTVDFEPLFPWFGPFLLGVVAGKLASRWHLWPTLTLPDIAVTRALAWPGRHSLAIYLAHQPILMGLIWLYLRVLH